MLAGGSRPMPTPGTRMRGVHPRIEFHVPDAGDRSVGFRGVGLGV